MLTTFSQTINQADDRFLNDSELQALETYVQSFSARSQAYQILSQRADQLVIQALKKLAQTHLKEVQTHSAKCKRDMQYAVKEIAKAVLMDENEIFQQEFALWMENITRAVHKGNSAAQAYTCLKAEVKEAMPSECAALVVPYIDDLITSFSGN